MRYPIAPKRRGPKKMTPSAERIVNNIARRRKMTAHKVLQEFG